MSEELLQRDLIKNPEKIGVWDFYNIGSTTIKSLKENKIITNVDYGELERKKVDGIIVKDKNVIAVVEYKRPPEFRTSSQICEAINQELNVAKALYAPLLIATDTINTSWINVKTGNPIKDESGKNIDKRFDPKDPSLADFIGILLSSVDSNNDRIKPKRLVNPTDLAKNIWQDIWSVSGATPENCLYTFVELFIFKYLSDLDILKGNYNFYSLFDAYKGNTDEEILELYANTIRKKIKDLFPESPIDKTTIINGTIFVSKDQKAVLGYSTVFKKILKKFYDYGRLEYIDYDFKSNLFESFLKESLSKKNWGQFFTPLRVVRAIIGMITDDVREGTSICDPACGVGKFLLEPLLRKIDLLYKVEDNELVPKITIAGYDKGFDKDEQKTIILAKANMLIYFSDVLKENPGLTKSFAKLFNESFVLKSNSILGTLSDPVRNKYDIILSNPPYVTSGSSNLKEEIQKDGDLNCYYKINATGIEGLFIEWIINALKPGGKAIIIVPDGVLNRSNDKILREFILNECSIDAIISLPKKAFFTTIKKTFILCLSKKQNPSFRQNLPVFTYIVSEIGESRDIYRFEIAQDDLSEAVKLYSFFKGNKENFQSIFTDPRCKVVSINDIRENTTTSWDIEQFWTKDEKLDLGIVEDSPKIEIHEFPQILDELVDTIKEFQKQIHTEPQGNITYKRVPLEDILDIIGGNPKYTKSYIQKNQGDFVVYSSNTKNNGIIGYMNRYDYNEECLQITTNGVYAGTVFYRKKQKFSINGDAKILRKKVSSLDYKYLSTELRKEMKDHGFNWEKKVSIARLKKISLNVPVLENGDFDLKSQQEISSSREKIEEIRNQLSLELTAFTNLDITY